MIAEHQHGGSQGYPRPERHHRQHHRRHREQQRMWHSRQHIGDADDSAFQDRGCHSPVHSGADRIDHLYQFNIAQFPKVSPALFFRSIPCADSFLHAIQQQSAKKKGPRGLRLRSKSGRNARGGQRQGVVAAANIPNPKARRIDGVDAR